MFRVLRQSSRLACAPFLAGLLVSTPAHADKSCEDHHADAQRYRKALKLKDASKALSSCLRAECPERIRSDCGDWLREVERALPTVVLVVKDSAGKDRIDGRVFVDGTAEHVDASAIGLDPGAHMLRVELPDGTSQSREIVVREGEKAVPISISFGEPRAEPKPPAATAQPTYIVPWVTGGIALLALGTGTAFAISHHVSYNDAETRCGSAGCPSSEVDSIRRKAIIADVAFSIAIVAGVTAVISYVLTPKTAETRARLGAPVIRF